MSLEDFLDCYVDLIKIVDYGVYDEECTQDCGYIHLSIPLELGIKYKLLSKEGFKFFWLNSNAFKILGQYYNKYLTDGMLCDDVLWEELGKSDVDVWVDVYEKSNKIEVIISESCIDDLK